MATIERAQFEQLFGAFTARDLKTVMAMFDDNAFVYDPHYPIPERKGKAAIQRGFEWGLDGLAKPGFTIRNFWADGEKGVVEVDTHHVLKMGMEIRFPQVFVLAMRNGLVTRMQAYEPYPPSGIARLMALSARLAWKLQGKA